MFYKTVTMKETCEGKIIMLRVLFLDTICLVVVGKMETGEKSAEVKLPQRNISSIKNKQRRAEAFRQLKKEKTKVSSGKIESCNRPFFVDEL